MTIDAGWVSMLKKTVPVAFSTQCPVRPNVVFIDGQIKLMKSQSIRTWNSFVELQFRRTIEKAFETGARVVVLGFDNYVHVPTAKNMTQRKRMQDVQALEFCADAELPSAIPENWDAAIKNRTFKTKVIGLVLRSLRAHFQHEAGSTLILDYMGTPEVLGRPMQLPSWLEVSETSHTAPLLKRGECDIKAFTWADMGPLLIESTDGDFIALGLIQTNPNRRIILHRIKTNIKPPGGVVTGNQQASGKLKREYEFVDISMLHKYLCRDEHLRASCLDDNSEDNEEKAENEENKKIEDADDAVAADVKSEIIQPKSSDNHTKDHAITSFASLVAMTGCDFCMNLPMLGPTRLWNLRQHIQNLNMNSERGQLVFITLVLTDVNKKVLYNAGEYNEIRKRALHANTAIEALAAYEHLLKTMLRQVSVAERTRKSLWSRARMRAHVRNTLWTLQYWHKLHEFADPLTGDYGFERHKNHVVFAGC
jgi:hypothetical protein